MGAGSGRHEAEPGEHPEKDAGKAQHQIKPVHDAKVVVGGEGPGGVFDAERGARLCNTHGHGNEGGHLHDGNDEEGRFEVGGAPLELGNGPALYDAAVVQHGGDNAEDG